jgi:pancreatic triacylglycerol lipase
MDPAGPGFYNFTNNLRYWRLTQNDANFVDIIHTSIAFGLFESLGDVDFWPNLGLEQPGCNSDPICSHSRSHYLFAESILSSSYFKASAVCDSPVKWAAGLCKCTSNCNHMGFYATGSVEGSFYLRTNEQSPFSINGSNVLGQKKILILIFFYFRFFKHFN